MSFTRNAENIEPSQILLVVNREARAGRKEMSEGLELLRCRGFPVVEIYTENPTEIPGILRRYGKDAGLIALGGGDGTFNCSAEILFELNKPLGILPLGTANDLARTLGIPPDPKEACRILAEGHTQRIDLGRVNGKFFLNVASIGLGVRVTREISQESKQRWGALSYARSLLVAVRENRSFSAEIVCDGHRERTRAIQIAVGNGRHYGGGMTVSDEAEIDDGLLHLYSLKPQKLWKLALLARSIQTGDYRGRSWVVFRSGRKIEIRTVRPMDIDTDGELTAHTPAHFEVVENALEVIVPAGYRDGREVRDVAQRS